MCNGPIPRHKSHLNLHHRSVHTEAEIVIPTDSITAAICYNRGGKVTDLCLWLALWAIFTVIPITVCHTWPSCHENPGARGPDLVLTTHQFPSCSPGNFPEDGASSEWSTAGGGDLHSLSLLSFKSPISSVNWTQKIVIRWMQFFNSHMTFRYLSLIGYIFSCLESHLTRCVLCYVRGSTRNVWAGGNDSHLGLF